MHNVALKQNDHLSCQRMEEYCLEQVGYWAQSKVIMVLGMSQAPYCDG